MLAAIADGSLDPYLSGISGAAHLRLRSISAEKVGGETIAALSVGDHVQIIGGQKYLAGCVAKVVKVNSTRVKCEMLPEHRARARRFGEAPFSAQPAALRKVAA